MPWNLNFRYNLQCRHTFWYLKLKTQDFSKFHEQYPCHFSNNCMHAPCTVMIALTTFQFVLISEVRSFDFCSITTQRFILITPKRQVWFLQIKPLCCQEQLKFLLKWRRQVYENALSKMWISVTKNSKKGEVCFVLKCLGHFPRAFYFLTAVPKQQSQKMKEI